MTLLLIFLRFFSYGLLRAQTLYLSQETNSNKRNGSVSNPFSGFEEIDFSLPYEKLEIVFLGNIVCGTKIQISYGLSLR